jgi:hypothetical protein
VYELVTNLLATTGAPAFLDDEDGDDVGGSMYIISFATPYGFFGFDPDCIAPVFYHHHHPPMVFMMDVL